MTNSYTNTSQVLDINELINFSTNGVTTGCTVTHAEGSPGFSLNKSGYYLVTFNGDASTVGTAGNIEVVLLKNGVPVPGAVATAYSAAAVNVQNLKFSTIIKVAPSCPCLNTAATLTLQNAGVEATYTNVNIVITKLY